MSAWDEEEDTTVYSLSKLDSRRLDIISRNSGIARSKLEKAARRETKLTRLELKQISKALRDART